jgi:hypothetical protein
MRFVFANKRVAAPKTAIRIEVMGPFAQLLSTEHLNEDCLQREFQPNPAKMEVLRTCESNSPQTLLPCPSHSSCPNRSRFSAGPKFRAPQRLTGALLVLGALAFCVLACRCSAQVVLGITTNPTNVSLSLPALISVPRQGQIFPEYTILGSQDLTHWAPVGGKVRGISGVSGPRLNLSLPN